MLHETREECVDLLRDEWKALRQVWRDAAEEGFYGGDARMSNLERVYRQAGQLRDAASLVADKDKELAKPPTVSGNHEVRRLREHCDYLEGGGR